MYMPTFGQSNSPRGQNSSMTTLAGSSEQQNSAKFCVDYNPEYTKIHSVKTSREMPPQVHLPKKPLFGYVQPWNGWCPPCKAEKDCANLPCQTHNLKMGGIYEGIEVGCSYFMDMAGKEALLSVQHGGGPFGAVIVRVDNETGEAIEYWKNHNHVELWSDPTAHAEVSTIRVACQDLAKRWGTSVFDLGNIVDPQTKKKSHCVIFSSAEPCPMCYAAINWARIPLLVFAATRYDAAQPGIDFSDAAIYEDLARPYAQRENITVYQASCKNSLDAFNQWKRMKKTDY